MEGIEPTETVEIMEILVEEKPVISNVSIQSLPRGHRSKPRRRWSAAGSNGKRRRLSPAAGVGIRSDKIGQSRAKNGHADQSGEARRGRSY